MCFLNSFLICGVETETDIMMIFMQKKLNNPF
jgi:hypothetical protein